MIATSWINRINRYIIAHFTEHLLCRAYLSACPRLSNLSLITHNYNYDLPLR